MNRSVMLDAAMNRREPWDFVIIGGGATGAGIAIDAASRGYSVLLLERADFGSGTSSRSTKLVHGGVRYLRQGHVGLVLDALRERGRLLRNAPHLVHDLAFVIPCYRRRDVAFYGLGMKAYDLLAVGGCFGRSQNASSHETKGLAWTLQTQGFRGGAKLLRGGIRRSRIVSSREVKRLLPTVRPDKLRGGVVYHDGQFDDTRLLIHLLMTAVDLGATVLNYTPVTRIVTEGGVVRGAVARDVEGGAEFTARARVVVNAAGPFCDEVRRLADPAAAPLVAASRGSHVVLSRSFLPTDSALLIPETPDGRVLFAIPWHGHTLVGTTDVPIEGVPVNPEASEEEIDFILETAGRYLAKPPQRDDVLATFAGIRPLVKGDSRRTASLSRDHLIRVEQPGLVTITGGKWTTYRSMAEDCVDRATDLAGLPQRPCRTATLSIHGSPVGQASSLSGDGLEIYGTDAAAILSLMQSDPALSEQLHPDLPYRAAEVVWAVRSEMARTVEDVLARRTRASFLNAKAAATMAPRIAEIMSRELGRKVG